MKTLAASLTAVLLFLGSGLSASAVEGTVQKIDHQNREIVLNTEGGAVTVLLDRTTKGAGNVKVGDKVKVIYTQQGTKLVAESIVPNKDGSPPSPSEMPGA